MVMAETREVITYHGNCHCGKYRFELQAPEITSGIACSCRQCTKRGYRWIAVSEESFTVVRDEGSLADFDSGVLADKFCTYCGNGVVGTHSAGPLKGQKLVNINLMMELDPFKIQAENVQTGDNDRTLPPLPSAEPPAVQQASCTCGKVRVESLYKIQDREIRGDNCSLCSRLAYVASYENKEEIRIHGREHTFEYNKGSKMGGPAFCKTCGVHMFGNIYGPPISNFDKLAPERIPIVLEIYAKNMNTQPVPVRTFDGVDFASLTINYDPCGAEGYKLDP